MPYIIFSQNKREVSAAEVALLLAAAKGAGSSLGSGSAIKQGYFNHWTQCLEGVGAHCVTGGISC
jgi:hypothetical protein